jgi:hypothetical protein
MWPMHLRYICPRCQEVFLVDWEVRGEARLEHKPAPAVRAWWGARS